MAYETDNITGLIRAGILARIKSIIDEEADMAAERVRKRVKSEVDSCALAVLERFTMQYSGFGENRKLIIEVSHTDANKTHPQI